MRTMQQQLIEKRLSDSRIQEEKESVKTQSKILKEWFSRKEWEEIMGMNRETYQKQGGAYRTVENDRGNLGE